MIHWLGYAEMRFGENAHLVLARAVEHSGSEALSSLPDAWLVEDRAITLNVELDSARGEMMAVKRLLSALLLEAEQGEAVIEVPPFERWSREAGGAPSLHQLLTPHPATITEEDPERRTIVSAALTREGSATPFPPPVAGPPIQTPGMAASSAPVSLASARRTGAGPKTQRSS